LSTLVFGHKNPDTDSVASAIALAYLKTNTRKPALPRVLGQISRETEFMLEHFHIEHPKLLGNVYIQVSDINLHPSTEGFPVTSILSAYKIMEAYNIMTLSIINTDKKLVGIITKKDIAMKLIRGDFYRLNTSTSNIIDDLNGTLICGSSQNIEGDIRVMAYNLDSLRSIIDQNSIIIVGDRYDVLTYAVVTGVRLILLTGGQIPPDEICTFAESRNISIISVPTDTYTTAKLDTQIMEVINYIKCY
jgi:manganese-dependent inorganic pyrophosphatase